jgi:putative ABC transport system permease protein
MGNLLGIAFRNLVQSRRRTTVVGLAIALVTLLLTLLLALARGIEDNMIHAATTVSAGDVNVAGFFKPTPSSAMLLLTRKNELRSLVEANTPGLDYIVERNRGWGKIISEQGSAQVGMSGVDVKQEQHLLETLVLAKESEYRKNGREQVLGDAHDLAEPGTAVIFVSQARVLNVTVGDTITIKTETMNGQTNTADARVVAVARDLGLLTGFAIFVPRSLVLQLYQLNEDTTGALWIYLHDIGQSEKVMAHLREVLAAHGYTLRDHEAEPFYFKIGAVRAEDWTGQQIDVTTWRDEVSFLGWIVTGFRAMTFVLTAILVGVIGVGIMNAMWTAVRERTREVGTMRAIGMSRMRVLALFLLEAFLLGLFATSVGAISGLLVVVLADLAHLPVPSEAARAILLSDSLHLQAGPLGLVLSVLVLSFFTSLAAVWPAIRAASLRPVQALSHVE